MTAVKEPSVTWLNVAVSVAAAMVVIGYMATPRVVPSYYLWQFFAILGWVPGVVVGHFAVDAAYNGATRLILESWRDVEIWRSFARREEPFLIRGRFSLTPTLLLLFVITPFGAVAGVLGGGAFGSAQPIAGAALAHLVGVFLLPIVLPTRLHGRLIVHKDGVSVRWLDGRRAEARWSQVEKVVLLESGELVMFGNASELLGSRAVTVEPSATSHLFALIVSQLKEFPCEQSCDYRSRSVRRIVIETPGTIS